MYRIVIIAICLVVSGCATVGPQEDQLYWMQKKLHHRFTYVSDQEKWGVQHLDEKDVTGETYFTGDCEEFASAAKHQLEKAGYKAERWLVVGTDSVLHAIACTDEGWCLDNANRLPMRRAELDYHFLKTM